MKRVYPLVQRIISEPMIVLDPPNAELFDLPLQIQGLSWIMNEYSAQLLRRFRPELSCSPISVPGESVTGTAYSIRLQYFYAQRPILH